MGSSDGRLGRFPHPNCPYYREDFISMAIFLCQGLVFPTPSSLFSMAPEAKSLAILGHCTWSQVIYFQHNGSKIVRSHNRSCDMKYRSCHMKYCSWGVVRSMSPDQGRGSVHVARTIGLEGACVRVFVAGSKSLRVFSYSSGPVWSTRKHHRTWAGHLATWHLAKIVGETWRCRLMGVRSLRPGAGVEGGGTNPCDVGLDLSGSWQQGHSATYNAPSRI
jgi:hypothetical protein